MTHAFEESPSLVSQVGDADTLPDLEEEIQDRIIPHFKSIGVFSILAKKEKLKKNFWGRSPH
jgi:hypothetical protein